MNEEKVYRELVKVGFRALRGRGSDYRKDDDLQEGKSLQNTSPNILLTWQDKEDIISEVLTDLVQKARRERKSVISLLTSKGREKGIPWQAIFGSLVKWKERRFHQQNSRTGYRWEEITRTHAKLTITMKHTLRKGIHLSSYITFQEKKSRKRVQEARHCPSFERLQDSVRSQEYYQVVELLADIEGSISEDLKDLARLKIQGYSVREIATRLGCSPSYISKLTGELKEQLRA